MHLSATQVKNAKPNEKPYKLYDSGGLYLQVTPSGGKWWRFKYRFLKKENLLSLGTYPDVSLQDARLKRDEARKLLAKSPPVDPSNYRKLQLISLSANTENTFELLSRKWVKEYLGKKSKKYRDITLRRFEQYLFPWIGSQPISDLTAPTVLAAVKRIQNQNKHETAYRTLQATGYVFRYAVQNGYAVRDVTVDLKGAIPTPKVKHMASITEPKAIGELLRDIDSFTGTFTVRCALLLAPLTFTRPGELRKAKWADINLDEKTWTFLLSKNEDGLELIVPLSKQALFILKELKPLSGNGKYVFMGGRDTTKPMSEAAINAALRRLGYDTKTEITGHGFRAMARTILQERLKIDPEVIEHQIGHKVPDRLGSAYNRAKFIEVRTEMMQQWADYLDDLKIGSRELLRK